ncbi:hypothetical protein ABZ825_27270 [Streptomyces tauricus]|uniref:hypothetical protein n=1 Tax=Streptomyces tauricus TaxID=68274 RepID=UPI0033D91393
MAGVGGGVFGDEVSVRRGRKMHGAGVHQLQPRLSPMAASANAPTRTSLPTRQNGGEHGTAQVHRRPHPYLPGQQERTIGVWHADGDRLQQPAHRNDIVAFFGVG